MKPRQMQIQQQLAFECLANFFTSLEALERLGTAVPEDLSQAAHLSPVVLDDVNRAILHLQTCVGVFTSFPRVGRTVVEKVLEWLAPREGEVNLIDELCCLLIARLEGHDVDLPTVVLLEEVELAADEVNEAAQIFTEGQHRAEKLTGQIEAGDDTSLAFPRRRPRGRVDQGLARLRLLDPGPEEPPPRTEW